jgi:Cu(I)/Ag(I) efflux system membrane fusion protein
MKVDFARIRSLLAKIPALLVIIVAFGLGYLFKSLVTAPLPEPTTVDVAENASRDNASPQDASQEEIWTCSMHPEVRRPEPGQCPKCGMDLILAKSAPDKAKPANEKKYACSMFCVPPLPKPGKCPVCGMDMVEVEDEGDMRGLGTLTLSPEAQKLAEIRVAPVERKYVEAKIRMVGKIAYDETRLKYITAWVPGRLDRLYVDYTGVPVAKGDHLVYMYSPELLVAQTELLQAIKTARELATAADENTRAMATRLVEDVRKKLRLWGLTDQQIKEIEQRGEPSDHMTIYAPAGGIVIHKNATEGMYVDTGTRIYTIADLTRVWMMLNAYESDLAWLRYGQDVEFQTEAYPGETFHGTIAFIDPVLDDKTRTVKVRVNVENADGRLKPEMFVRAEVQAKVAEGGFIVDSSLAGKWISPMHPEVVKDQPGACDVCGMPLVRAESLGFVSSEDLEAKPPLVIPASAPLLTGKRAIVYIELPTEPGTYEGRQIVLGPRAGDHYLVTEGLVEGERVVVNGNFKIDSAVQIQAKPSMMKPEGGGPPPGHDHGGSGQAPDHEAHVMSDRAEPSTVPSAFEEQLGDVFQGYYALQTALSLDALDDAQVAARKTADALGKVDMTLLKGDLHNAWMKEVDGLRKTIKAVASAKDIEKARTAFALLSESMIAVARKFGAGGTPAHRLHCPMAFDDRGANWLQNKKPTANPYFGSAMFRCGVLKETLGSKGNGG